TTKRVLAATTNHEVATSVPLERIVASAADQDIIPITTVQGGRNGQIGDKDGVGASVAVGLEIVNGTTRTTSNQHLAGLRAVQDDRNLGRIGRRFELNIVGARTTAHDQRCANVRWVRRRSRGPVVVSAE